MAKYSPDSHDPTLSSTDLTHMTRRGWFPATSFAGLEEMRLRHEELIDVREGKQAEVTALRRRFAREDQARTDELNRAYAEGREIQEPDRTAGEERQQALAAAEEHANAAAHAVLAYAYDMRERLRGAPDLPDDWTPGTAVQALRVPPGGEAEAVLLQIAEEERALREELHEAQQTLTEADDRLRELMPLKFWLARNGNGDTGQIEPGHALPVPLSHTPGTKPRDLNVPGWWQDGGDGVVVREGEEHLIPEGATSAVVDTTDPEILEMERKRNGQA